ncbi:MAG: aspartate--tRNA(Asn) ligase [Bacilli bacterium]|nr:aspartate--tRNA(Asn) ligase [Bacilli bacterium]
MQKVNGDNLNKYLNQEITISGWVDSVRDLPFIQFIILRNLTDKIQITIEKNKDNKKLNDLVTNITNESVITVTGLLNKNDMVKLNQRELIAKQITLNSLAHPDLPINIKDKDKALRETRLNYRFLDLRRLENLLIFKVQTTMSMAMRDYFINNNYMEIHSPRLIGTATESGAEVFEIDYFGTKAYLSQSPQFYKQMAMAAGFERVFEIGNYFRAEKSHTSYHATEFTGVDIEVSFIDSHHTLMDIQEEWIKYYLNIVIDQHAKEIKEVFKLDLKRPNYAFPRLSFQEAKSIIKDVYQYESDKKDDLDRQDEELIDRYIQEKYQADFVFITDYPFSARPFYHMLNEDGLTKSYDLLYKGVEITTGAQREHRYDILKQQVKQKGLNLKQINFYLDFFKYGCPPHGGFGFGLNRFLMRLFDIDNIREATYLYRGPNRLYP